MKLFDVFPLFDLNIVKGEGCYVYDDKGNKYLDLYGGHAVISVGHTHPYYVEKVTDQLNKLGFYSNSVINKLQVELAGKLGEQCGYPDYHLFLINSGAEANENAIKLASFHNGRRKVLAFKKAFHGRTSVTVAVTDIPAYSAPVNRTDYTTFVPFNDIEAVKKELETKEYSSVIIEGIQGVAGIHVPDDNFLKQLRDICTETGTILILDEIQSGYGRTGKFFAHQYAGIQADLITVAKGIANGFPMAGVLINPMFKAVYGQLGTTFGGNHLGCAAAIAVLDIFKKENLIENAKTIGDYLITELKKLPKVKEVRGRGLIIGIEFDEPIKEKRSKLLFEDKIFTGATGTNVFRLLPPLCLTKEQADEFLIKFKQIL
ncbi:aspartate aminotransferase family protein [Dysgonomonas macrotermitis]|uniref:Acetylornithine aminotransferase n=1 Tax=Dysgonomonas macrotermitis TaxID=1346286 RepID=A0A1M5AJL7_9BACT|nr:aminotransferase class III-fold pyridoxal phosphate-dependent enzyme [Dysgonomonas macrotermitis]SHF30403.1 acetylornithine aminotransferase [Dysgonomonas macrotermitis]